VLFCWRVRLSVGLDARLDRLGSESSSRLWWCLFLIFAALHTGLDRLRSESSNRLLRLLCFSGALCTRLYRCWTEAPRRGLREGLAICVGVLAASGCSLGGLDVEPSGRSILLGLCGLTSRLGGCLDRRGIESATWLIGRHD
jgi:hypothetical protein